MNTDLKRGFNGNAYEIKSDRQTLWINRSYGCVARFSTAGVELIVPDLKRPVVNTRNRPKPRTWSDFKKHVADWYGFNIEEIWCPLWITEETK